MFQNVSSNRVSSNIKEENKINLVLKELFKPHNCVIYILTILVSMVSIKREIIPFGLAILAACMGGTVPIFMVYIASLAATALSSGMAGVTTYFCTSAIFFVLIFMFKPKISLDDRNEVLKVGSRLFLASFLYNLINNLRDVFLIYDLFLGLVIAALTYTFYKIFVNGIVVIRDFNEKKAFTVEELIAAAIIFSIAISVLKDVTFFSLSISNILIIFMILVLGWKNGMLVGAASGLSIGLALTLVGNVGLLQLTVFAVSGILAGALNKFGKVGVVIGFLLGNAILTYLANGNLATIIHFREIFIAAFFLIFVPSNIKLKVEDLLPKEKMLDNPGDKSFEFYEDVKEKLNAVVNTISEINRETVVDSDLEIKKETYINNFIETLEEYNSNIFYDEVYENETLIGEIFDEFEKNDIVTENVMIDIFKKHNNYILLRDRVVKDDLQELIKIANRTYRELQIKKVKAKVKKEENQKVTNQLKNVTKIIKKVSNENTETVEFTTKEKEIKALLTSKGYKINSVIISKASNGKYIVNIDLKFEDESIRDKRKIANIASIISKCFGLKFSFQKDKKNLNTGRYVQTYSVEDKFSLQVGCSKSSKNGSKFSGDSNLQIRLEDGKYLLAISDGMGSGKDAKGASKFVINTLNNLLEKGFEEKDVLNLINSELNLNKNDEMYASVDMSVLDLYLGNISIIKNGACNTYIKNSKNEVKTFSSTEMPVGVIENVNLCRETVDLNEGDIILMCSDGLLESCEEKGEDWPQEFLKNINTTSAQKIADLIMSEAIDNSYGIVKDDITVIVAKIIKKH